MASNRKILITGAAGFIGSHLVDHLLKKTDISNLVLFVKKGETMDNLQHLIKPNVIFGDIRNKDDVKRAVVGVDTIYHLAAKIDFDGKSYREYESVNVEGTKNLIDECRKMKIKKFVLFSSIGVYGLPAGIGQIRNWNEKHAKTYTNYYGRSKLEAEEAVIGASNEFGLPYSIIRPASVYGPREKGPTYQMYKAIKNGRFAVIGKGDNLMHYVFVEDLVKATILTGNSKRKTGDYIIAGPKANTLNEVTKNVAESIGLSKPSVRIPVWAALLLAHVFGTITSIAGIKFPLYPSRVKTMTTTYFYDISKAKKELNFVPKVNFKKGTRVTGKWYLENNWI